MESIAIVLLFIVLGGGALLVALIYAIASGSARSDKLRQLEQEQASLRMGLHEALGRVTQLERALGDAMTRIAYLRSEQVSLLARGIEKGPAETPAVHETVEKPTEAPAVAAEQPEPAKESEAIAAPSEAQVAAPDAEPEPVPVEMKEEPAKDEAPAPVSAPAPAPVPESPAIPVSSTPPAPANDLAPAPAAAACVEEPLPPPSSAPLPPPRIDWERWIGVRGAAALGACILVIAGLYFFKYSIDAGLISPTLRVILGTLVGLGGVVGSELTLRRKYTVLANWLAGAGVAILYIAFWAACRVYGLIDTTPCFALMILVTAACGVLSLRHDTMVVALLGLLGGFTTPVALTTGEDHPFGLFGYLLLLDGALLYLAQKRRWPVLAGLSLLGTALYQAAWIGARMDPDRLGIGIAILLVFGGVYAFASPAAEKGESEIWKLTRAATVVLPFAFGLYFGLRSDLGDHLYPIALMLCVLSAGAAWIGRARGASWAGLCAAIAGTTVIGAWMLVHDRAAVAWEASLLSALLAAVFHGFLELEVLRPRGDREGVARAATTASLGALFCLVCAALGSSSVDPWPWLTGWLLVSSLAVRQSLLAGSGAIRLTVAVMVDFGFAFVHLAHAGDAGFPHDGVYVVALVAMAGLALLSAALLARRTRSAGDEVAMLLPFATLLSFAVRGATVPHLAEIGVVMCAIAAAASYVARARRESGWVAAGAAVSGLVVIGAWLSRHPLADTAWESALVTCAFAAVFHVSVELAQRAGQPLSLWASRWAVVTPVLAIVLLAAAAAEPASSSRWPWLLGWVVLAAMALRQAGFPDREPVHVAVAVVLGLALPAVQGAHSGDPAFPGATLWMAAGLVLAMGAYLPAFLHERASAKRFAAHGAGTLALLLMLGALPGSSSPAPRAFFSLDTLALAALALFVAARLGVGGWAFAAALTLAFTQTSFVLGHEAGAVTLAGQLLGAALLAFWPLFAARLRASSWAWRAAALAGPLSFAGLYVSWTAAFGKDAVGLLPIVIGLLTFAAGTRARAVLSGEEAAVRRTALVWLYAVTLCAVSLAIPLQLDNEWVTVGWALEGVALLALWRRMDHAGLKYTALMHLAVVAMRLGLNPWVLSYHPRSSVPVFNWLAYTYWIPVLALAGAWYQLRDLEVTRRRPWEGGLYLKEQPTFAMMNGAAAIALFFVWINLTIFDAFGTGSAVEIVFERLPARDLTLSLAWAIYALSLLALGMARRSAGLRWASLALIITTMGKVFLYDLSHLHDLYRVMSLVGLALSLILISLAYQRFVFGKRTEAAG